MAAIIRIYGILPRRNHESALSMRFAVRLGGIRCCNIGGGSEQAF